MLIDTHAHLNFSAYKRNLEEVIKRVVDENVWIINVGSKYETSKKALEIALRYKEGFYAAVGLHPIHAAPGLVKIKTDPDEGDFITSGEDFDMGKYKELALSEKVVAIGEIGLDYYYRPKTKKKIEELKNKQKEVFKKQLGIAKELNLPVIFHCRMAHQDLTDILKENKGIKGVVHCFTGTLKEAEKYMEMGFYIGLNGIIFKLDLGEIIKQIPLEKILIETDCPYLTPPQVKAEQNEPIFVKYVAQRIAELKNVDFDKVAEITTQNAKTLFGI